MRKEAEQLIFMEKVGLEDGMSRRASEELWQYENRYDSDNETTFDSDNDSNVAVVIAMVRNNICFIQVEAIF